MTTAVLPAFKAWVRADQAETEAWKRVHRSSNDKKLYAAWESAFAARKSAHQTYLTAKGEVK